MQPWTRCMCVAFFVVSGLAGLLGGGCAPRKPGPPPRPTPAALSAPELGLAAHYADRFAGRKTASGEPYRPAALTAAHRTLPFGTLVRVTRVDREGRTVAGPVVVRVNDRGPYGRGRVIDLSAAAARKLRMLGGIARVRVEVVKLAPRRER